MKNTESVFMDPLYPIEVQFELMAEKLQKLFPQSKDITIRTKKVKGEGHVTKISVHVGKKSFFARRSSKEMYESAKLTYHAILHQLHKFRTKKRRFQFRAKQPLV